MIKQINKIITLDLFSKPVTVANTTTETSLYNPTILAGTMGVKGGIRCVLKGYMTKNAVGTFVISFKLNGTYYTTSPAETITSNANDRIWTMSIYVCNTATNSHIISLYWDSELVNSAGTAPENIYYKTAGTEDTTADMTMDIRITWSAASPNLSITNNYVSLELLRQCVL